MDQTNSTQGPTSGLESNVSSANRSPSMQSVSVNTTARVRTRPRRLRLSRDAIQLWLQNMVARQEAAGNSTNLRAPEDSAQSGARTELQQDSNDSTQGPTLGLESNISSPSMPSVSVDTTVRVRTLPQRQTLSRDAIQLWARNMVARQEPENWTSLGALQDSTQSRARTRLHQERPVVENGGYVSSDDEEEILKQVIKNKTPQQVCDLVAADRMSAGDMLDKNKCWICLDSYREILTDRKRLKVTKCGHVFCSPCVEILKQSSHNRQPNIILCSVCRAQLRKTHDFADLHLPLFNSEEIDKVRRLRGTNAEAVEEG